MSKLIKCINLDWLEVFCYEAANLWPMNAAHFSRRGWNVEERPYGTRSYREMFTLYDQQGHPFVEVRRNPVAEFKDGQRNFGAEPYGCHLRLVNRYCYFDNAAALLQEFINREGFTFARVAKVDLALDFVKFDSGDVPADFLRRYLRGAYAKINQSRLTAHANDQYGARQWTSVSWGAERSPVLTRFYLKTKELAEVKDKPYIRQAWALAGLVDNPVTLVKQQPDGAALPVDVWRVEFSVRSAVKGWITIDNEMAKKRKTKSGHYAYPKLSFRNDLSVYDGREKLLQMFESLAAHYFRFVHYEDGRSKYKATPKQLFNFCNQQFYKVAIVATETPAQKIVERLIRALQAFNVKCYDLELNQAATGLIQELEAYQLKHMANDPWDKNEVALLRALISRRLSHDEPFNVSQQAAVALVELERSLWSSIGDAPD